MKSLLLLLAAVAWAQPSATRILVAYHSQTGNTAKLAEAVRAGAAGVEGATVTLRKAGDVTDEDIRQADGIIVGTPVHWSNLSAETKRLLDHIGSVLSKDKAIGDGRTAGAFCTGGGIAMGKDLARVSILAAFLTMRFVVIGGVDAYGFGTLGPQATTGAEDPGISDKEAAEARDFGRRFAEMTRRFRAAR
ncbi:MAG: flavodoxin family protein [Acidobacteriota bacterium]|nr:flavodoxin family protein [Acidobacteriota bacterium]